MNSTKHFECLQPSAPNPWLAFLVFLLLVFLSMTLGDKEHTPKTTEAQQKVFNMRQTYESHAVTRAPRAKRERNRHIRDPPDEPHKASELN